MSMLWNIQIIHIIIIKCPITNASSVSVIQQFFDPSELRYRHLLKQGSINFSRNLVATYKSEDTGE